MKRTRTPAPRSRSGLVLLCLLLLAAPARAQSDDDAPGRAPLVGRPADVPFTEASASFGRGADGDLIVPFTVQPIPTPTRLRAGEPLRYRVTIRARGKVHHPPERIDLHLIAAFARDFHIEDLTEQQQPIAPSTWQWDYRLKPRHSEVRSIPGLPFAYYNPDLRPEEKGFQVLWTDPIPLQVAEAEVHRGPVSAPPSALRLAQGPGVLRRDRPWPAPGPWAVGLAWGAPAALAGGGYFLWRWRYPDAARLARRRRSRAARRALRALNVPEALDARQRGARVALALGDYLRERFDLPVAEPTPEEGRALLAARHLAGDLAGRAAGLLAGCDAARFGRDGAGEDLPAQARALILAVEEQACTPSP